MEMYVAPEKEQRLMVQFESINTSRVCASTFTFEYVSTFCDIYAQANAHPVINKIHLKSMYAHACVDKDG